ncbi:hypothetical protein [Longimicrobium sp.]|jgi:hypothetical protein|uniref:hypothetical protein n=1 Tax=Longimicrobium sp. TaxID=2029185 RepID=UPI002ED8438B
MANEAEVYRKSALERLTATDELDELLRLTPPHEWLMLAAAGVLLALALAWAVLGSVPARVQGEGYMTAAAGGAPPGAVGVLFLPPGSGVKAGMPVRVEVAGQGRGGPWSGRVVRVAPGAEPALRVRVEAALSPSAAAAPLGTARVPVRGSVTVGRVRPISFLVPGAGDGR